VPAAGSPGSCFAKRQAAEPASWWPSTCPPVLRRWGRFWAACGLRRRQFVWIAQAGPGSGHAPGPGVGQLERCDLAPAPPPPAATFASRSAAWAWALRLKTAPRPVLPPEAAENYGRGRLLVVAGSDRYRGGGFAQAFWVPAPAACAASGCAAGCRGGRSLGGAAPGGVEACPWRKRPRWPGPGFRWLYRGF